MLTAKNNECKKYTSENVSITKIEIEESNIFQF